MPLVVEDGTGLSNADAYESLVAAVAFAEAYGRIDFLTLESDEAREIRIRSTTLFLDFFFEWPSRRLTETQSLQFPRESLTVEGRKVTGVPFLVKKAMLELATLQGQPDLLPDQELSKYTYRAVELEGLKKAERFRDYIPTKQYYIAEGILRPILLGSSGAGIKSMRMMPSL